jgi:tetratricopeptide (TPR) repeat protein
MGAQRPKHAKKTRKHAPPSPTSLSAPQLLAQSAALLQQGQPEAALEAAQSALKSLSPGDDPTPGALPALALLGEIHLELGDPMSAREAFLMAADLDPQGAVAEGAGGGPEKFMWLAQLSEEGGRESLGWYEKGVEALQRGIAEREGKKGMEAEVEDMKKKLSNALCGMIEVWMTDLS